jgi:hypothetical protein
MKMTDENTNSIKITLDDVLGPDGLEGAWEGMVRRLSDRVESKFLHSDAGRSFHSVCVEAINSAVETRVMQRLEALMSNPIQITDGYGDPKGDPTTFNEMIGKAVDEAMTIKTDAHGRCDRHGKTILSRALSEVARSELTKAVNAEVKKVHDQAKQRVATEVAAAIAKAIK